VLRDLDQMVSQGTFLEEIWYVNSDFEHFGNICRNHRYSWSLIQNYLTRGACSAKTGSKF